LRRAVEQPLELHHTVAFFESPLRLGRTLRLLTDTLGDRQVVVAREVTKVHETFHTGTAAQLAAEFAMSPPKGECTVLVAP
jgi:16S rRNA (cytidine1402-2'-O)-methyltransferase